MSFKANSRLGVTPFGRRLRLGFVGGARGGLAGACADCHDAGGVWVSLVRTGTAAGQAAE